MGSRRKGTLTLHLPAGSNPLGPFVGALSSPSFPFQPDGLGHLEVCFNPSSLVFRIPEGLDEVSSAALPYAFISSGHEGYISIETGARKQHGGCGLARFRIW